VPQRFVRAERDQQFLLPPDMREWLPEGHLVWLVVDAVGAMDLSRFRAQHRADGQGRPAFDPELMLTLLLYGYCQGERSSRLIERRCVEDVAYRVAAGGQQPDHATIARFRVRHESLIGIVFSEVLRLLAADGLVRLGRVAIDGTKIAADASWSANKTLPQIEQILAEAAQVDAAEDAEFGDARGDELPPALADPNGRAARLAAARDRLIAEDAAKTAAHQAKIDGWQERHERGGNAGRKPNPTPPASGSRSGAQPRANVTDPDARVMKSKHTLITGYNAQAVVTDDQVIVGAVVSQSSGDLGLLPGVLEVCASQLQAAGIKPALRTVLADAGYGCEDTFKAGDDAGLRLLIPLPSNNSARQPHTAKAVRRLRHHRGRADYKTRKTTVEPTFGQLKTCQDMTRFSRRGHDAVDSEFLLACAAHNLLKLHRNRRRQTD
jgi:transposase